MAARRGCGAERPRAAKNRIFREWRCVEGAVDRSGQRPRGKLLPMSDVIFDDMFMVKNIDPDGKKFDRCSRLFCDSESFRLASVRVFQAHSTFSAHYCGGFGGHTFVGGVCCA